MSSILVRSDVECEGGCRLLTCTCFFRIILIPLSPPHQSCTRWCSYRKAPWCWCASPAAVRRRSSCVGSSSTCTIRSSACSPRPASPASSNTRRTTTWGDSWQAPRKSWTASSTWSIPTPASCSQQSIAYPWPPLSGTLSARSCRKPSRPIWFSPSSLPRTSCSPSSKRRRSSRTPGWSPPTSTCCSTSLEPPPPFRPGRSGLPSASRSLTRTVTFMHTFLTWTPQNALFVCCCSRPTRRLFTPWLIARGR